MSWPKENAEDKATKIILFLISPFFAALYSLKTMNRKSSFVMFFLFAVFFGIAFSVPSGKDEVFQGDGASYRQNLIDILMVELNYIMLDFMSTSLLVKEIKTFTLIR